LITALLVKRAAAALVAKTVQEPDENFSDSVSPRQIIQGEPPWQLGEVLQADFDRMIRLLERAYRQDPRAYQRQVGEAVAGGLTSTIESQREDWNNSFDDQMPHIEGNLLKRAEAIMNEYGLAAVDQALAGLEEEMRVLGQSADSESEECDTQIEIHQNAAQEFLREVNGVFRRFHFLPGFLLSAGLATKVSMLLGGAILGMTIGLMWGDLFMFVGILAGVLPGGFLLFVPRLPSPQLLSDALSEYYRYYSQRIYHLERVDFLNRIVGVLQNERTRFQQLAAQLSKFSAELLSDAENIEKEINGQDRSVIYLVTHDDMDRWQIQTEEMLTPELAKRFRNDILNEDPQSAIANVTNYLEERLQIQITGDAESKLYEIHGEQTLDMLYNDSLSLMKMMFTLAVHANRHQGGLFYHRSYIVALANHSASPLARALSEKLKRDKVGLNLVENDDPLEISILGLEGGFTIGELREGSQLIEEFERKQDDPLIRPSLVRRRS
jgi:hypothetical protein